jgi:hypothetical protein
MKPISLVRGRRGRPQKFGRPSRAVTLTLPEDVIAALSTLDSDLGRAVVRMSQPLGAEPPARPPAELSQHRDRAVIIVKSGEILERIAGVTLVPLPDGRALISLDESTSIYEFELNVRDAVSETGISARERSLLQSIVEILTAARQRSGLVAQRRSIIVLQSTRQRRGRKVG